MIARADAGRLPLADRSVSLCCGSPPYCDARTYGIGAARDCRSWVDWMLRVTAECLRVTDGPVIWVAAGVTRDRTYWPACEGLMWRWFDEGWTDRGPGTAPGGSSYRPCYWHRVGIPGSGGDQWYRADVEYAMCFKRPGPLPYGEPTANGHPPKWAPGGEMSHRLRGGERRNRWGMVPQSKGMRRANGKPRTHCHEGAEAGLASGGPGSAPYGAPVLANPGNLIHSKVGGGQMGSSLSHENEAPYPESVPAFFVRSHVPPGGRVLDPFSGSGSTAAAALAEGREYVAFDLRQSQCQLSRRRLATVTPSLPFAG